MNAKKLVFSFCAVLGAFVFSSCQMMEHEEKPIRPKSPNSDLAHGHSSPSGDGALGGAAGSAFSR